MKDEERYYRDITAIKECSKWEDVNVHLERGWELLKIADMSQVANVGSTQQLLQRPLYVLGQSRVQAPKSEASTPSGTTGGKKKDSERYEKQCNKCNQTIRMVHTEDGWRAENLDGSSHYN